MSSWKNDRLDNFFTLKRGFDLPTQSRNDGEVPIISSSGVTGFHNKIAVRGPGVVTGRYGTIGEVFYTSQDYWPLNTTLYVSEFNDLLPKFVYYFLKSFDFDKFNDKSTVPGINRNHLHQEIISIPDFQTQEAIAEVLSSLDDKIDLLHRNNKTLEQLAETLFRQWFVEEAEDGWEEGTLADLVIVRYGKDHQKLLDGTIPAFGSGGLMRKVEKSLYCHESVLIPRKGTLSNIMYIDEPFWTVDTMFYTEMRKENVAKFVYHFLKGQDLASMNVGSAVPSMTTEILNSMAVTIPTDTVLNRFEEHVSLLYQSKNSNFKQISRLETLRDTLLPKLMSGLVRVKI